LKHKKYVKLIEYKKNWLPQLLDGIIYYQDLKGKFDRMRANSVFEKCHGELKEGMPLKPK